MKDDRDPCVPDLSFAEKVALVIAAAAFISAFVVVWWLCSVGVQAIRDNGVDKW